MYKTFPENGYSSPDAFIVLTVLASQGAKKLGLSKEVAYTFGMGYGFFRTAFISCYSIEPKQLMFYKLFYPLGVAISKFWELEPLIMKEIIKEVYKRFQRLGP